jgi:Zn-dependent protease
MGVAGAIGVFFSIVFHEFSHSIVARHYGLPIRGITLFIFGGVAEMEDEPPSAKSEFLMAVAGPIASFVLAFVFSRIEAAGLAASWPTPIIGVSNALAYVNAVVAIFNLVPAFPLDGGRMLRAAIWYWKKDMRYATRIASQMGNGFGLLLMILGGFAFIQGNIIGGMWWLVIGIFLRNAAAASYQQLLFRDLLREQPVSRFMRGEPVTVPPDISVREFVEDYVYQHHFKMFPVVLDGELLGAIAIDDIKQLARSDWPRHTVRELMQPVSDSNSVAATMPAEKLLTAMVGPGRPGRFMVVDKGSLVGIISLKDVLELLSLKIEMEPPEAK